MIENIPANVSPKFAANWMLAVAELIADEVVARGYDGPAAVPAEELTAIMHEAAGKHHRAVVAISDEILNGPNAARIQKMIAREVYDELTS